MAPGNWDLGRRQRALQRLCPLAGRGWGESGGDLLLLWLEREERRQAGWRSIVWPYRWEAVCRASLPPVAGGLDAGMSGALGGVPIAVGTLRGCVSVRRRSVEEEEAGMGGGLGGVLAGGGTLRGLLAQCRGGDQTGKGGYADGAW